MQVYNKKLRIRLIFIYTPIIIAAVIIDQFIPQLVSMTAYLGFLISFFLILILIFVKDSKEALEPCPTKIRLVNHAISIIILQLLNIVFAISMLSVLLSYLFIPRIVKIQPQLISVIINKYYLFQPISWSCLAAVGLIIWRYRKFKPATFQQVLSPIFKSHTDKIPGLFVLFYSPLANAFVFYWFTALSILLLSKAGCLLIHIPMIQSITMPTLIFCSFIAYPYLTKESSKIIRHLTWKNFTLGGFYLCYILLTSLIIIFFSLITFYLQKKLPAEIYQPQSLNFSNSYLHQSIIIFALTWMYLTLTLQGSILARLGRIFTVRQFIIFAAILPSLIFYSTIKFHSLQLLTNTKISITMTSLGCILFLILIRKAKNNKAYEIGYIEQTPNQKFLTLTYFIRSHFIMISFIIFIYLLNGLIFLHVISLIAAIPIFLTYLLLGPAILTTIIKGKNHGNRDNS